MTLQEAVYCSKTEKIAFKRKDWHYSIYFCDELGYFTDGYNGMDCSVISIEDAIAEDYILLEDN